MTSPAHPSLTPVAGHASALALRLAHAENALQALASGQIDAVIDPDGKAHLLRPAQEYLWQNERRLQAVIDSSPDVITIVNRGGMILSLSSAARRVLGCEPEALVGKSVFESIHADDFTAVYSSFFKVIEGLQETDALQFRHRSADGAYRVIYATVGLLHDSSAVSVVFSLRLASQRISQFVAPDQRENAGPQTQLSKDRFLAMLAHELCTPLSPALLGIEELQLDPRFAEAGPTLAMIRRNIELEARLLKELFDFTSLGQRKIRLHSQWIDIREAIRLALETCRPEIGAAQIQVLLDFRASEAGVLADPVKLQQVMWNLIKNAVKFSPPRSAISISTIDAPPDRLVIEFTDQGIGIEPELLPLIFDSFQQGDPSRHQVPGGLGLGLFIAKGLTEAHGGTLTVSSEGHSKGATFCLILTKAPPSGAAPVRDRSSSGN